MSLPIRIAATAWLIAAGLGLAALHAYESSAGPSGSTPGDWPAGSSVRRAEGRPTVVVAVHPRCPCTRASLATLGGVVRRDGGRAAVRMLIYRPSGSSPGWGGDRARRAAESVPGAEPVDDPGGAEAARFGLETSGAAAAFDALGRLRFVGGLNPGRGVSGESAGAASLAAVLEGGRPSAPSCEAFGCPIVAPRSPLGPPSPAR